MKSVLASLLLLGAAMATVVPPCHDTCAHAVTGEWAGQNLIELARQECNNFMITVIYGTTV